MFQVEFDSPGKGLNGGLPAPGVVLVPGLAWEVVSLSEAGHQFAISSRMEGGLS
jgi:hypothetical protein